VHPDVENKAAVQKQTQDFLTVKILEMSGDSQSRHFGRRFCSIFKCVYTYIHTYICIMYVCMHVYIYIYT
jgi:hypothetical protein